MLLPNVVASPEENPSPCAATLELVSTASECCAPSTKIVLRVNAGDERAFDYDTVSNSVVGVSHHHGNGCLWCIKPTNVNALVAIPRPRNGDTIV